MATTKVSALVETTSPQANDELLINQSGVSKKVKITNLPAGLDTTKLPLAGGTMTGNIVMSGSETVDGRDVSADGTQLDANTTAIALNTAKTGITSGQASAITANTAKVTNATHTGDVTGATALTIAAGAVDIAMMSATGTPSGTTYLRGDNAWATVASGNITTSGLYEMANIIASNYSIASGNNAISAGPITINTGVTLTVATGYRVVIV